MRKYFSLSPLHNQNLLKSFLQIEFLCFIHWFYLDKEWKKSVLAFWESDSFNPD